MRFFLLEPEVAGGEGEHTEMEVSVHPPVATRLHYEVAGWQGDDLLESTPCFVISPEAAAPLAGAGMESFTLADALITLLAGTEDLIDWRRRPARATSGSKHRPAVGTLPAAGGLCYRWSRPAKGMGYRTTRVTPSRGRISSPITG